MSANRFPTSHQRMMQVMVPVAIAQAVQGLPEYAAKKEEKPQHHDNKHNFQPKHDKHTNVKSNHVVQQPAPRVGKHR